jgi:hypothetical protein
MKKPIIIVVGVILVIVLALAWAYLLFYGTPKSVEEVFSNFGEEGQVEENLPPPPIVEENTASTTVNLTSAKLRQLTTRPIAGYKEIPQSSSTPASLYYAEKGTGHVYSISLETGEERRISGTTIPQANRVEFSEDGEFIAITNSDNEPVLRVGKIGSNNDLELLDLEEKVTDFHLTQKGELLYANITDQGLGAVSYNLKTGSKKSIFSIPFHEATILWGEDGSGKHHFYPKTSYALPGYLYEVSGGIIGRLPFAGNGFSAKANSDIVLYTTTENNSPSTHIYNFVEEIDQELNSVLIPEKCFLPETGVTFYCGQGQAKSSHTLLDSWYKGQTSFKDTLVSISSGLDFSSEIMVDTFKETSREVDAINIELNTEETKLYFINKNDNTLWLYEI